MLQCCIAQQKKHRRHVIKALLSGVVAPACLVSACAFHREEVRRLEWSFHVPRSGNASDAASLA